MKVKKEKTKNMQIILFGFTFETAIGCSLKRQLMIMTNTFSCHSHTLLLTDIPDLCHKSKSAAWYIAYLDHHSQTLSSMEGVALHSLSAYSMS